MPSLSDYQDKTLNKKEIVVLNTINNKRLCRLFALAAVVLAPCVPVGMTGCGGGSSSTTTTPTVTAPAITTQPTAQTVLVAGAAILSVVATGTSLKYQWYKDGSAISGATASTYTIASAAATDAGSYSVVVTNSAGAVTSNTVTLTVSTSTGGANVTVG